MSDEQSPVVQIANLSPEDQAVIQQIQAQQAQIRQQMEAIDAPTPNDRLEEAAMNTGMGALKALDEPGGVSRGLLFKVADALTRHDGHSTISNDELVHGLSPTNLDHVPGWNEYMARRGIGSGGQLSDLVPGYAEPGQARWPLQPEKGGMLDPSLRGTVSTGLDTVSDPLLIGGFMKSAASKVLAAQVAREVERGNLNRTMRDKLKDYASFLKPGNILSTISNPTGNALEYAGTRTYRSGLRPLDEASLRGGKIPISPQLMQEKGAGTAQGFAQHINDKVDQLEAEAAKQGAALDADAVAKGATPGVDMKAAMKKGQDEINRATVLSTGAISPPIHEINTAAQDLLSRNEDLGVVPRKDAIKVKGDIYRVMPESAFDAATHTAAGSGIRGQMARGIKEAVESTPWNPALGKEYGKTMEDWGNHLTVQDTANEMAGRAANKPLFDGGDSYMAVGANASASAVAAKAAALRKAMQWGRTTGVKTFFGKTWQRMGRSSLSPLFDGATRQYLLDGTRETPNSWSLLSDDELKRKLDPNENPQQ